MFNLLLTGSSGLIGSELLSLLSTDCKVYQISHTLKGTNIINLDLSNDWDINALPKDINTIIHLAQSPDFREFPQKAESIFNVNVRSTQKLLEYAQKIGVKKFIYASSGGVYGNGEQQFSEDSPLAPSGDLGFYLSTKLCSEILLESYTKYFDIVTLRFFFVYGKKQNRSMLIPRLVDSVKEGKVITLQGEDGIKINPIHVKDAAQAIKNAIDLKGNHKINIAGKEVLSLKQIIDTIAQIVGKGAKIEIQNQSAKNLIANIDKMEKLLTSPQVTFQRAIEEMI